jgi:hypothetical protein
MTVASLDTHALIRELTTGTGKVSEATAEKLVTAIKTVQDASRGDLATKADIADLRVEIEKLRADLTIKMFGGQLATVLLILGAFKYFTH